MDNLFSELKRRNIFRVAGVYAVIGWVLAQMASLLESAMNMPGWFDTMVVSSLLLGFPIAMVLTWAFEMTPEGVKRTESAAPDEYASRKSGRGLDYALIGSLALVGLLIIGDQFRSKPSSSQVVEPSLAQTGEIDGQSIAVLPFEDFSPEKDQAYFADGIAEELLNVLAQVDGLRVASRTSAFSFKTREASISEIATALNVGHILEGSVRKSGETLRITAQLIDTETDEHLWSETFDRPLTAENIFEIQDEISQAIVLELNGQLDLLPETSARPTQSAEAYDAYLKGKEAYRARTEDALNESLDWMGRAVTLDPDFASAHASLARIYMLQREYAGLGPIHARFRSKTHIDRALALAPNDWDVLSESAWQVFGRRPNLTEGIAAFDAAIAANPNNSSAHRGRGLVLTNYGENEEGLASFQRARQLDPQSVIVLINIAGVYDDRDDIDGVQSTLLDALRLNPDLSLARGILAYIFIARGDIETAHRIAMSCKGDNYCDQSLGYIYSALGMDDSLTALGSRQWATFLAFKNDDADELDRLVSEATGFYPLTDLRLFNALGRPAEAYSVIQNNPERFEFLLDDAPNPGTSNRENGLSVHWALKQAGDSRAEIVRASLKPGFDGVEPGPRNYEIPYINGAQWRMVQNDPDGAMAWLNALADRGVPTSLVQVKSHWFEPLHDRPDYQAFEARMLDIASRDRTLIEAQLANPPETWWHPDEVLAAKD
ncbi:MAG: tetratricopeptide repeat protein [Pseudomonadota bacterium]